VMYRHIAPVLYRDFRCIADECPANCCSAGWSITWTAAEVERLKNSQCPKHISDKISTAFDGDKYCTVHLDSDGSCPFLTAQGLCAIQKDMGEQYLSYTCRQYPRISRFFGDVMLSSCRPTCYAVMDRLYSESDCMELTEYLSDADVEALITDGHEKAQRLGVFGKVREILWRGDIEASLADIATLYNIKQTDDIQTRFEQRYGWSIIASDSAKAPDHAVRNIVLALFMEYMITRYDARLSEEQNIAELLFKAQAVIVAVNGAAALCEDRTQLLCSIADFIAAL